MTCSRTTIILSFLIISLFLFACATGNRPALTRGPDIESLLAEAGFQRNAADSPEKLERIRAEVQHKVIPVQEDGKTYYVYADAEFCQCLYVGDELAFSRFEDLLHVQNLQRNSCIDDRLRSTQSEPWREFGALGDLCRERP